jgi:1-phosphofructokinase family hexose kinase
MIITLTPNTGIDYTLQVPSFQLNSTIRATDSAWGMGGKPIDASWILGRLGVPNLALGFAAGPNGERMETMLHERGVETDFVLVEGESRLNTILVVSGEGQSTITSSSLHVSPEDRSALFKKYQDALEGASCVVMGGSLPKGISPDFYTEAIDQAHAHKVPVIFDSSGPPLAAGLKSRPGLIKPNQAEVGELLGSVPASIQEARQAAQTLHDDFGAKVIVTLGSEGAIAVSGESSFLVHPLSVPVVSSAGAGDGVLAGMSLAFLRGEPLEYGLQHGFALAGAVLQTLGTADFRIEDYQELLSQVRIERLE